MMYLIGQVNNLRMAQAFIDYANGLGATCQLKEIENGCEIWLVNGEKRQLTEKEFEEFIHSPNQGKYIAASWQTPNQQIEASNDLTRNPNQELLAIIISKSSIFVTIIFALCWIVFIFGGQGQGNLSNFLFFTPFNQPFDMAQPWRVVTPALIHFSMLHITMNLIMWWHFGGLIEIKQSTRRLITLFFFAAIISNTAQYLVSSANFGGMSGVVYALFGYVWIYTKYKPNEGITMAPALFGVSLFWMAAGFFELLPMNIANTAHLTGLLSGLVFGYVCAKK